MPEANIIKEHMEVVGSDGVHVGTIDHIEEGRIKLTKAGSSDGQHHYVTTAIVQDIRGNVVTLTRPAVDATEGAVEDDQHGSEISSTAQAIDADDPHKAEKLTKLGHEGDEKPEGDEAAEGTE